MKARFILLLSSVLLLSGIYGCWTVSQDGYTSQSNDSQAYSSEYNQDDLNTYGEWTVLPEYGRVWKPSVNTQWQPFADGHWVYDGNDWVWDSYEPYGAIVYHYGNWEYVSNHRWIWIPNRAGWSPACVDWIYYGDEVAWSPRPRPGHSFGNPWDNQGHQAWVVVRNENFYDNNVNTHRITDVSRDKGKYRDDQINRKQPSVTYVREHTQTPITVTQGISRNGSLHPTRGTNSTPTPANNNPAPVTGTSTGRPTSTSSHTPATQTPATQPATTQPAATQPTTTQTPGRNNNTPGRTEPTTTNTGTNTTTGTKRPTVGGQSLDPTPVKPQPVKSTVKTGRTTKKNIKSVTTQRPQQQQPAKETQKVKKDSPVKVRQQPVEQKAAPSRDNQDRKVESR
jgi:hypothetical protein